MPIPPKKPTRPRGPSPGGRKKLPSKGGARRTASIRLSKVLGDLLEGLQEQNISMKPEHLAELQAIQERNFAGTWNENDLKRALQLHKVYVLPRKKTN